LERALDAMEATLVSVNEAVRREEERMELSKLRDGMFLLTPPLAGTFALSDDQVVVRLQPQCAAEAGTWVAQIQRALSEWSPASVEERITTESAADT
ncbi:MAG: hypothetical protein SGPRY_012935, partial [Prymnesium sp.]